MVNLKEDWLTDGLIDFEYKKYLLMAYIKDVKSNFKAARLYPFLSDLVFHYNNLLSIKKNKNLIYENFPKVITKADFEKLKINYKKIVQDDELMQEIEDILSFSIPELKKALEEGKEIYEDIAQYIKIEPVGITPLNYNEGYLMVTQIDSKEASIYYYQLSVIQGSDEKYKALKTEFLEKVRKGILNTYEKIKTDLIDKYQQLPNPATFLAESKVKCPYEATLMPITKRKLMSHIEKVA